MGMLLQPHPVALGDASQRFCVIFQPHCNLAVSDPAQDGRRGQLMPHNEEAGDATGCAARILTASGALSAADECNGRALGRAIPLAGHGEGWSAPRPLAGHKAVGIFLPIDNTNIDTYCYPGNTNTRYKAGS